ncbi:MAG: S9 family peptidase, partial [bacterium]|nr:S9 family peptidase [bacterium]
STRDGNPEIWPGVSDIYVVPIGGGEIVRITTTIGSAVNPVWSPDGKHIAYIGNNHEYKSATLNRVWVVLATGGEPICLTANFDRAVGDTTGSDSSFGGGGQNLAFSADGKLVYFIVSDRGASHIFTVNIEQQVVQLTSGARHIKSMAIGNGEKTIAFVSATAQTLGELFVLNEGDEKKLTEVNGAFLSEVEICPAEEFWYKATDGWDIQGWLIKPVGCEEGKKYPLVLHIHGGPHTQYGVSFFFEMQLMAANGYGVLFTNPRGSTGYGQKFVDAVRGDYGGKDYEDLMSAVDYTCRLPWVDAERLGVTGGSYGGFMTNWIVTHTNRFKGAVTLRSISNWTSFSGVSDIGYF